MPGKNDHQSLIEYIDTLQAQGRYYFTWKDLEQNFDLSANALRLSIARMKRKKEIASVRNEFYIVLPPPYRAQGMLPPSFFIEGLMKTLNKPYYVGLLSAAAYYGAAHQQPQAYFIVTTPNTIRPIHSNTLRINFYYRKTWEPADITKRKTETGYINVSCPELTALDLVFFQDRVGGLNRVATVLDELAEEMDPEKLALTARHYQKTTATQRLGYLLGIVLGREDLCGPLLEYINSIRHFPALLQPSTNKIENKITGNDWNIIPNVDIQTDL